MLHSIGGRRLALCHDETLAQRWAEAIERAIAAETDIVTVSSALLTLTPQQIIGGLYRAPRSVIGVPGMNDYQERINKYYGLDSPSTVPKDDAVVKRRHFGEVVALMRMLLARSAEGREVVPFYEALPFSERCESCRVRPAETLDNGPVCGVCQHKRREVQAGKIERAGIVHLSAVGLEKVLEAQRTPAAYRKVCVEMAETLGSVGKRPGII